jgi:hypothetical protein
MVHCVLRRGETTDPFMYSTVTFAFVNVRGEDAGPSNCLMVIFAFVNVSRWGFLNERDLVNVCGIEKGKYNQK